MLAGCDCSNRCRPERCDDGEARRPKFRPRTLSSLPQPDTCRPLEVDIAIPTRRQTSRTKRCKTLVEQPAGFAILRIARIPKREDGVRKTIKTRDALAKQEVRQRARLIRWIAIAVGAHDQVQQALLPELAQRVIPGRHELHGGALCLERASEALREAPPIAGLRAIEHRRVHRALRLSVGLRRRTRDPSPIGGETRGVTRNPGERRRVEAVGQLTQQRKPLAVERSSGQGCERREHDRRRPPRMSARVGREAIRREMVCGYGVITCGG